MLLTHTHTLLVTLWQHAVQWSAPPRSSLSTIVVLIFFPFQGLHNSSHLTFSYAFYAAIIYSNTPTWRLACSPTWAQSMARHKEDLLIPCRWFNFGFPGILADIKPFMRCISMPPWFKKPSYFRHTKSRVQRFAGKDMCHLKTLYNQLLSDYEVQSVWGPISKK